MFAQARSRSASDTSSTWSKRATALRTWLASVNGSLRCRGKAKTESGRSLCIVSRPGFVCGSQVACVAMVVSFWGCVARASPPGAARPTADPAGEQADQPEKGEHDGEGEQPLDRESEPEEDERQNCEKEKKKHAVSPLSCCVTAMLLLQRTSSPHTIRTKSCEASVAPRRHASAPTAARRLADQVHDRPVRRHSRLLAPRFVPVTPDPRRQLQRECISEGLCVFFVLAAVAIETTT